jgi:hypothetical protein
VKYKYIIDAIKAMSAAEHLSYTTSPAEFARITMDLRHAAIALQVRLDDVEIEIEKEAA